MRSDRGDVGEIERFLVEERRAAAGRIARLGVAAMLFGGLGAVGAWLAGGLDGAARAVHAAPVLLLVGAALTGYGAWARGRAE